MLTKVAFSKPKNIPKPKTGSAVVPLDWRRSHIVVCSQTLIFVAEPKSCCLSSPVPFEWTRFSGRPSVQNRSIRGSVISFLRERERERERGRERVSVCIVADMATMGSTVLHLPSGPTGVVGKLHPTVLFNICDSFIRRNDQQERVIGTLLGSFSVDGTVEIRNSYAVPHNESLDQVYF